MGLYPTYKVEDESKKLYALVKLCSTLAGEQVTFDADSFRGVYYLRFEKSDFNYSVSRELLQKGKMAVDEWATMIVRKLKESEINSLMAQVKKTQMIDVKKEMFDASRYLSHFQQEIQQKYKLPTYCFVEGGLAPNPTKAKTYRQELQSRVDKWLKTQ